MTEGTVGSTPWRAVRRHAALVAVIALLCCAVAVVLALVKPVVHRAEVRLAVGGSSLTAQAVPGFALASQQLAANYARYIGSGASSENLVSTLRESADSVTEVTASPIPESNVVRIEVYATDAGAAVSAAASLADSLIAEVNDSAANEARAAEALDELADLSARVASTRQALDAAEGALAGASSTATNLPALRQAVVTTTSDLAVLEAQQQAADARYRSLVAANAGTESDLRYVQEAALVGDDRVSALQLYGIIGLFTGGALATAVAIYLDRRPRRHRRVLRPQAPPVPGPVTSSAPTVEAGADGSSDVDERRR